MVAEEIRKLAARTQSSAQKVTGVVDRIRKNTGALTEHVRQVAAVTKEQATTSKATRAGILALEPMARDLTAISGELVK